MEPFKQTPFGQTIPKTCFMYWDGSPFSLLNYISVQSFRKFHPDWDIKMYMPINRTKTLSWFTHEQKIAYNGPDYFDQLHKLDVIFISIDMNEIGFSNDASEVIKSDYLRYWLLYTYGGIWSDCDIIYIKPLSDVFTLPETRVIICCQQSGNIVQGYPVGFLASEKNNPFFKTVLDGCARFYNPLRYESLGSMLFVNLFPQPSMLIGNENKNNIIIMDKWYYLPYDWNKLHLLYDISSFNPSLSNSLIRPTTFGIHWFNGAQRTKEFLNNFIIDKIDKIDKNIPIFKYLEEYLNNI